MKKPYISQEGRYLIESGTLNGSILMLDFRIKQFGKSIAESYVIRQIFNLITQSKNK